MTPTVYALLTAESVYQINQLLDNIKTVEESAAD